MKKLYRIEEGKKLCGVCGGIAEYFDLDPTIIRIGFIILSLMAFVGVVGYFVCALVMPVKPE